MCISCDRILRETNIVRRIENGSVEPFNGDRRFLSVFSCLGSFSSLSAILLYMDRTTIERNLEMIRADLANLLARFGDVPGYCAEIEDAFERLPPGRAAFSE